MDRTNAERQRRYTARLKEGVTNAAAAKSSSKAEKAEIARLQADVARLCAVLAKSAAEIDPATLTDGRVHELEIALQTRDKEIAALKAEVAQLRAALGSLL